MNEKQLAHKLFKSAKYNQYPFDKIASRFGLDTITARELISKYYGDLINPELVITREGVIDKVVTLAKRQPVLLYGSTGSGKTSVAKAAADKLGTTILIDLGDARTGEKLKEKVLDTFMYPNNVLILENLDYFDGRSHKTMSKLLTESKAKIILTTVAQKIPPSIDKIVSRVYISMPEIADVANFVAQKFPSWEGDIEFLYTHCKGDMRRIIRCISDDIVDHNLEDAHTITPQKACELILYEEDRAKVLREISFIEGNNWFFTIQFLRQNVQYAFRKNEDKAMVAEKLAIIDMYKFTINKDVLFSLLASFPLATKRIPKIYFPTAPRKKLKKVEEKLEKTKEKIKDTPKEKGINYANVI